MKFQLIFLFYCAVFGLTRNNVNCFDIFEYVKTKLIEFSRSVSAMIESIGGKFSNFFIVRNAPVHNKIEQSILEERVKKSFDEYVRAVASSNDPDLLKLRSDPAALMSTPQLANLHCKKILSYVITTKDGYILTLHRLYNITNMKRDRINNTVLLNHGLFGSSADWILLGPKKSLPYILSDAGYDVWMANARGNYYSRGHASIEVNSTDYWNFSFQEMGEFDLPAIIHFIRNKKNQTGDISYVGHSMGATALLVLLSTKPSYNRLIRVGILLAPLAFMTDIQGPLRLFTSMSNRPPHQFLRVIGNTECFPSRKIPKMIASSLCNSPDIFCSNPLFFLAGGLKVNKTFDTGFTSRLLYHVPAGASTNTILHYGQLVQNEKFHRFGKSSLDFSLDQVSIPVILISSTEDWLATVPDVMRLYFSISNPKEHIVIRDQQLSHTEFVWGENADKLIFSKILEFLKRQHNSV